MTNEEYLEQEKLYDWDKITIQDNFMFSTVMMDREICTEFLEAMLQIKIDHINYLEREAVLENDPTSKGIRLDVFAKDTGKIFDIEMQVGRQRRDLAKRTRYYQSVLDISLLDKGMKYRNLPESYILFICPFDPFKKGLPVYTFQNVCGEDGSVKLNDKAWKILYNVRDWNKEPDEKRRAILKYIYEGASQIPLTQKMQKTVDENRHRREWRKEYMTLEQELEEQYDDGFEDGMKEGKAQVHAKLQPIIEQQEKQLSAKDVALSQKDAEISLQAAEIEALKKQMKELLGK